MGGIAAGLVQVMQHRRKGKALGAVQVAQQLQQVDLMADIQPGGRLIQQHDRCLLGQHHRNPRPLTLSAGEGIHALRRQVGNTGGLHRFGDRQFILFTPAGKQRLVRIAPARHQLLHRDIPRRSGVLRQQPDPARHLFAGKALNLLAIEENVAMKRRHQAAEGAQQG